MLLFVDDLALATLVFADEAAIECFLIDTGTFRFAAAADDLGEVAPIFPPVAEADAEAAASAAATTKPADDDAVLLFKSVLFWLTEAV